MALPLTDISISDIHQVVGGASTDQASLNDSDIRTWGNLYNVHASNPSFNVGSAGIPTTSNTEIAIGEFRGGFTPASSTLFSGTFTHKFQVNPGGQYTPTSFGDYSNAFSNPNFTGSFMGLTATHTVTSFSCSGLSSTAGLIQLIIQSNSTSMTAPSNSGWTSVTFKSYNNSTYTLQRSAASFSPNTYSAGTSATYTWGTITGNFNYPYAFADYFGGINNRSISGTTITYLNHTDTFRINV
tara:strand:- start:2087 stop:2809 length:723 start_codon:yes stop_codon:yes gene_type:complete